MANPTPYTLPLSTQERAILITSLDIVLVNIQSKLDNNLVPDVALPVVNQTLAGIVALKNKIEVAIATPTPTPT